MLVSFSPATGHTLPDRYIEGTCPICGYPEARGDQCDNCGNQLDPIDLINPRSRIDGSTPEFRETKHLFLDLPQFADALRTWINAQDGWRVERQELLAAPARRDPAAPDHARSRLGRHDPGPRLCGGSEQADLRLVRRGHRLPLGEHRVGVAHRRPRRLARLVAEPRRLSTRTSRGRTTSSSTRSSGRRCSSATAPAASTAQASRRSSCPTTSSPPST